MPEGIHHDRVHLAGWVVILPSALYATTIHFEVTAVLILSYAMGRYLNPDADIVGMTYADGLAMRHFKIFGNAWVAYWTFYGAVFKNRHRSLWTHFPFISTAIRMVYLFWWLYFIPIVWYDWQLVLIAVWWFGLSLSDIGHYVSDMWFSNSNQKLIIFGKK